MSVMTDQRVELRCPVGPQQLLAKLKLAGGTPQVIPDPGGLALNPPGFPLLELSCRDCAKGARRDNPTVSRVLHRFNVLGQLVESEIIER